MSNLTIIQSFQRKSNAVIYRSAKPTDDLKWFMQIHPHGKEIIQHPKPEIPTPESIDVDFTFTPQHPITVFIEIIVTTEDTSNNTKSSNFEVKKISTIPFTVSHQFYIPKEPKKTITKTKKHYGKMITIELEGPEEPDTVTVEVILNFQDMFNFPLSQKLINLASGTGKADCVLVVKGKKLTAHRLILAAASEVLAVMFASKMREGETGEVVIDDVDVLTMKQFLTFIYGGKCSEEFFKERENTEQMISLAHKYDIPQLMKLCTVYLSSYLNCENASSILDLANLYGNQDLQREAVQFIAKRLKKCREQDDFFENLSPESTQEVLRAVADLQN